MASRVPKRPGRPVPARSVGPAVGQFFAKRIRHHKGPAYKQPFRLEPWQENPADLTGDLDLIYETRENGERQWLEVLWGMARGQGKSPVVSGCGMLGLLARRDSPEIVCAAGSREQAQFVYEPARWNIDNGPLSKYLVAQRSLIRPRWRDGVMKVLSADGKLSHGGSISEGLIDEVHVFTTPSEEELVAGIRSALHKRPGAFLWGITTAGFDKRTLLGEWFDRCMGYPDVWQGPGVTIARDFDARSLMIWRAAPDDADIEDPETWRLANPASWLALDAIGRQLKTLRENDFRRLLLNQWTKAEGAWLPKGAWSKATNGLWVPDSVHSLPSHALIPEKAPVYVGVDVGLKKDSSAIVTAWPHDR